MNGIKQFLLRLVTTKKWYEIYSADTLFSEAYESFGAGEKFKAISIFKKLAERGNARGQWALGGLYEAGIGVAHDNEKALFLFTQSAEQGYIPAQYSLAKLLEAMERKENNPEKYRERKLHWFKLLVHEGHEEAQLWMANELSAMISEVPPDNDTEWKEVRELYADITKLFLGSSFQGNGYAQYRLGLIYKDFLKDSVNAYAWLRFSETQGYEEASKVRDELFSKLSADEYSQAAEEINEIARLKMLMESKPEEYGRAATFKVDPELHFERMRKVAVMPELDLSKKEVEYYLSVLDAMQRGRNKQRGNS